MILLLLPLQLVSVKSAHLSGDQSRLGGVSKVLQKSNLSRLLTHDSLQAEVLPVTQPTVSNH